ncbi:hypothetical protein XENTR_v10010401 [Xenopus tropicalis]|nr:hypothetical protein XENTR_v10010401 [Xenopus tropicalis]
MDSLCINNQTLVVELVLLGFGNLQQLKHLVFVLFLIAYITTLTGNVIVIGVIISSPRLHNPMYIFLCNLSLCEILFTTNIVPNMLSAVWGGVGTMTVYGCFAQFYIYTATGSVECLLLTTMAFDRYLAICNPLRYSSMMDLRICKYLALCAWLSGFLIMSVITVTASHLELCGSNIIDHIFCDLAPILKMSSTDTFLVETEVFVVAIALSLLPFTFIVGTYTSIFRTIVRISSASGRQKAFYTCSTHLASVGCYFGTLFTIYLFPSEGHSATVNKILSLLYTVVTPLLNPMIYSLRNQEMKFFFALYMSSKPFAKRQEMA